MENIKVKLPVGRPTRAFEYWESASNPGHRHSSQWWIDFYAKELLLYFPKFSQSILECGCGTGTFFSWFKERCSDYVGVDFSNTMLQEFKKQWPDAKLVCADASNLPVGEGSLKLGHFDFIFSNQVCQFFDKNGLKRHLECVSRLLKADGQILIANVPDAQLRLHFYAGALKSNQKRSWLSGIRNVIIATLGNRDGIGHWYTRQYLAEIAALYGFVPVSFSSSSLEYRYHMLLTRKKT